MGFGFEAAGVVLVFAFRTGFLAPSPSELTFALDVAAELGVLRLGGLTFPALGARFVFAGFRDELAGTPGDRRASICGLRHGIRPPVLNHCPYNAMQAWRQSQAMSLLVTILIIILIVILIGAIPVGRRNRGAGIGLGGVAGTILIILLILWLVGAL